MTLRQVTDYLQTLCDNGRGEATLTDIMINKDTGYIIVSTSLALEGEAQKPGVSKISAVKTILDRNWLSSGLLGKFPGSSDGGLS